MARNFVLTLTGADRIGIVEEVTGTLLERGGNVETSRMVRLGGEFAVLMLVSVPEETATREWDEVLDGLRARGYTVTASPTERPKADAHPGWARSRITVEGADHEGIIHRVSRHLSAQGISIEAMETETTSAPFGAAPLFNMSANVAIPPNLFGATRTEGLDAIGEEMNLEIRLEPIEEG